MNCARRCRPSSARPRCWRSRRTIASDAHLAPLVQGLREEAERLNDHIQNLLDATRISSEGIRPHAEWVDPGDIVNAAIERKRRLLAGHQAQRFRRRRLAARPGRPDAGRKGARPIDRERGEIFPAGDADRDQGRARRGIVRIAVTDRGVGMTNDEREQIFERFYRSPRHRDGIPGSGFGLWIAHSLVAACDGHIEAFSAGIGRRRYGVDLLAGATAGRRRSLEGSDD